MKQLSPEAFARAKEFIQRKARLLDRRLFEYTFENGGREGVFEALPAYQNEDGGFGQAIEPDFRLPASSPMATSIGLGILRNLHAPAELPLVQKAMAYLLAAHNPAIQGWHSIPRQVNDYPHAPWWHYDEATGNNGAETRGNPSAELIGSLHTWPELVPADFLRQTTAAILDYLQSLPEAIEMHELMCFMRMATALPEPLKLVAEKKIRPALAAVVARDPQSWAAYGPQPLMFVASPESPFAADLRDALEANLDYLVDSQGAEGGWSPNWSWGDSYPEAWQQAKREWQGQMTVDNLRKLRAFGRIQA